MRSNVFRIFLSSTFVDFKAEREALRQKVWPKLELFCKAHGAAFEVVDLRWGISEADDKSHDTLRICLDEIAHCQQLSPKPNFLLLVGNRYGWRPLPSEIPKDEFSLLIAHSCSARDRELLKKWYRLDNNADPPYYRLKSKTKDWEADEPRLVSLLRARAGQLGLTPERREMYMLSATHLEIIKGALALKDPKDAEHVFGFFRDIQGLDLLADQWKRFTDLSDKVRDEDAAKLLSKLRHQIAGVIPRDNLFIYQSEWTGSSKPPITTEHIEKFCEDVDSSLRRVISEELTSLTSRSPLDQEKDHHKRFAREKLALFIGRDAEVQQVTQWAEVALVGSGTHPVIVHGPGGVGKSAFMAKATDEISRIHPDAVVIQRFIGDSPRSSNLITFLGDLLREIAQLYGQKEALPEGGLKELIDELPKRLNWATAKKPLLLMLDALDQFNPIFEASHHQWLPESFPPHVAVVLSVLDGEIHATAKRRFHECHECHEISLKGLDRTQGKALLEALLLSGESIAPERKRKLTAKQQETVLKAFEKDGRPLYLVLVTGIVRHWRSWDRPKNLPGSIEELVHLIIKKLERGHGKQIVDRALGYLLASRFGISDEEMRCLLWTDKAAHNAFEVRRSKDHEKPDALPPIIWSRIYFELAPYLTAQGVDGALLHQFFHRIMGETVAKICLAGDKALIHKRIANYFAQQHLYLGNGDDKSPNLRKLMEEPWQRIQAGQLDKAEVLLTDFDFVMAKCKAGRFEDLLEDFRILVESLHRLGRQLSTSLTVWDRFMRRNAHILRRAVPEWTADRILLQLAVEHADDSPLTIAAEKWLDEGKCDWVWLRNIQRPVHIQKDECIAVLKGETDERCSYKQLADGQVLILSWSKESLYLWDSYSGTQVDELKESAQVLGAKLLPDGRILAWLMDETLSLWDKKSQWECTKFHKHPGVIRGAQMLPDGHILSLSSSWGQGSLVDFDETVADEQKSLRLWDQDGNPVDVLSLADFGFYDIENFQQQPDGRILFREESMSQHGTKICKVYYWDRKLGKAVLIQSDHPDNINWAPEPSGNLVLSRSPDAELFLHDPHGKQVAALRGRFSKQITWAKLLPNGHILSKGDSLRLWNIENSITVEIPFENEVENVWSQLLSGGRILSMSSDNVLQVCDAESGRVLDKLKTNGSTTEYCKMHDGRVLIVLKSGKSQFIWDSESGMKLDALGKPETQIKWSKQLVDKHLLVQFDDATLKIWDKRSGWNTVKLDESEYEGMLAAQVVENGNIYILTRLSREGSDEEYGDIKVDNDCDTLFLWDASVGGKTVSLEGHKSDTEGARMLSDDSFISWSSPRVGGINIDGAMLRLWSKKNGWKPIDFIGHAGLVKGALPISDDRLLSWSTSWYDDQVHGYIEDDTLRIWDSGKGTQLHVLEGNTGEIITVLNLPEADQLLSCSKDGLCIIWTLKHGEYNKDFYRPIAGALTVIGSNPVEINPDAIQGATIQFSPYAFRGMVACWHDDSANPLGQFWSPSGKLAVQTGDKRLVWLQLYDGAEPHHH